MQVLSTLLCDYAADYQGKLCVMGAFDTLRVRQFPVIYPHCALALRFSFQPGDEGEHRFQLSLIDPDGNRLLADKGEPSFNFNLKQLPADKLFLSQNFIINLQGLSLPRAANYSFDLRHNGEIIARIPLQAMLLPAN